MRRPSDPAMSDLPSGVRKSPARPRSARNRDSVDPVQAGMLPWRPPRPWRRREPRPRPSTARTVDGRPVRGSIRWCRSSGPCRHRRLAMLEVARAPERSEIVCGRAGRLDRDRPRSAPGGRPRHRQVPAGIDRRHLDRARRQLADRRVDGHSLGQAAEVHADPRGRQAVCRLASSRRASPAAGLRDGCGRDLLEPGRPLRRRRSHGRSRSPQATAGGSDQTARRSPSPPARRSRGR